MKYRIYALVQSFHSGEYDSADHSHCEWEHTYYRVTADTVIRHLNFIGTGTRTKPLPVGITIHLTHWLARSTQIVYKSSRVTVNPIKVYLDRIREVLFAENLMLINPCG